MASCPWRRQSGHKRLGASAAVDDDRHMTKKVAHRKAASSNADRQTRASSPPGRIHPVVIYPFRQPDDYGDLKELYGLVARLSAQTETYARPITVMDRKTYNTNARSNRFLNFRKQTVARCSVVLDAWCVDTCQMWYTGLGAAVDRGGSEDVYWLIPGDFNYGTAIGREVLSRLHDLPEIIIELGQDLLFKVAVHQGEFARGAEEPAGGAIRADAIHGRPEND